MATKDFIDYTPASGNKNETISVTANKNTGAVRTTSLNISAKGITKTVTINQKIGHSSIIAIGNSGNISLVQLE